VRVGLDGLMVEAMSDFMSRLANSWVVWMIGEVAWRLCRFVDINAMRRRVLGLTCTFGPLMLLLERERKPFSRGAQTARRARCHWRKVQVRPHVECWRTPCPRGEQRKMALLWAQPEFA
jgi:hypothetical protein